jgi:hypothetical protein
MTWFAIRCAPQREIAVEAMLRRKGYDVFLPTEVKSKKVGKRKYVRLSDTRCLADTFLSAAAFPGFT